MAEEKTNVPKTKRIDRDDDDTKLRSVGVPETITTATSQIVSTSNIIKRKKEGRKEGKKEKQYVHSTHPHGNCFFKYSHYKTLPSVNHRQLLQ